MKFSYEWLKELVKFKESPEKLAELLTLNFAETIISYRKKRAVLNVDLLPNRIADASGHLGMAREISAILGKKFNYPKPEIKEEQDSVKYWVPISIKSKYCRRYVSRSIWRLTVKSSPKWLKERLEDCGLRPINNVVDAANYVMLLTGQPLHVFDFQKVAFNKASRKEIIIREAKQGEKITTLENKTYNLKKGDLLICDTKKPLAIAGIKGGMSTEVDKDTGLIIIEGANFDPVNIRLTSQELRLKTDASMRFEHNLKPNLADYGVDILTQLIYELAGGEILKGKSIAVNYPSRETVIPVSTKKWEKFLGWPITKQDIIKKLSLLGFKITTRSEYVLVAPPLYRNDIENPEDILGEIARIAGLNKIPILAPKERIALPPKNDSWELINRIKDWLKGYRLEEVYNYSLISLQDKENLPQNWQDKLVALDNPLSNLFCYLRPTLLLNFLKNINSNFRFIDQVRFFEIGELYYWDTPAKTKEEIVFAGALARKSGTRQSIFYEAKGIIEGLFTDLGIDKSDYSVGSLEKTKYTSLLDKGMALSAHNKLIGVIGIPGKMLCQKYNLGGEIAFWEINLSSLMELEQAEREYKPLPQFPAVIRDISLITSKNVLIDKILQSIQEATSFLEDADLFDIYEGGNLAQNKQSLSFHLIFRSPEKTLRLEEIDSEMEKIYLVLKKLGAEIR